jgi:putative ABC transport system permease protein
MIRNYLRIAWRNLRSNRGTAAINLLGLTIGLASCLVILLYVRYESSFDGFHRDADRMYRVITIDRALGVSSNEVAITLPALAQEMQAVFPEVEDQVRMNNLGTQVEHDLQRYTLDHIWAATPSFQTMFDFGLIKGDPKTALAQPHTALISESAARLIFNTTEVTGQTLRHNETDLLITGVMPDAPPQSHLAYDLVISMLPTQADTNLAQYLNSWHSISMVSYVKLRDPSLAAAVEANMEALIRQHDVGANFSVILQPLADVHLGSSDIIFDGYNQHKSDRSYVYTLLVVALFVLLIAAFNYMNLATARSARRAREVGLRKVIGARRAQLMTQFMVEAVLLCLLACGLALALTGAVGELVSLPLPSNPVQMLLADWPLLLLLIGGCVLLGVASGSYPAFMLSGYQPIAVLKGSFARSGQGLWLRRALVTLQFAASTALIIGTVIVYQQLALLRTMDKGFDPEQVLTFTLGDQALAESYEQLATELRQLPGVLALATGSSLPGQGFGRNGIHPEGQSDDDIWIVSVTSVDDHFLDLMGMSLAEGRHFDPAMGTDSVGAVLINETMASKLGWTGEAPGKRIEAGPNRMRVVGVVKDFHFGNMRHQIEPLMLFYQAGANYNVAVRVKADGLPQTLAAMADTWQQVNPDFPWEYEFLDEAFGQQFERERDVARLVVVFTWLAIFIACLGLLGLSAFAAEQRTKEIGIRKVLGASPQQLVSLLSRELTLLVLVAALVAMPLAWYLMQDWLAGYAYHIDMPWWVFPLATISALAIALLTNAYHAIRTAHRNPVHALRSE